LFVCLWDAWLGERLSLQTILLLDQKIANRQRIHLGAHQTTDRLVRRADNRLVFVEAGVEDDGDADSPIATTNSERNEFGCARTEFVLMVTFVMPSTGPS